MPFCMLMKTVEPSAPLGRYSPRVRQDEGSPRVTRSCYAVRGDFGWGNHLRYERYLKAVKRRYPALTFAN
ncbi:unnamed protein product [Prunus armeniaca]